MMMLLKVQDLNLLRLSHRYYLCEILNWIIDGFEIIEI